MDLLLLRRFLVFTAVRLLGDTDHSDDADNAVVRFAKTHLNTTDSWHRAEAVPSNAAASA